MGKEKTGAANSKVWLLARCSRCDGGLEQNVTRCKSEDAAKKNHEEGNP